MLFRSKAEKRRGFGSGWRVKLAELVTGRQNPMRHCKTRWSTLPLAVLTGLMALAPLFIAASTRAIAQPYPAKPVRVIVPYAPGGGVDIMARIAAQRLGERMGVQFVVEPRWGRNRDRHRNRRAGAGEVKERIIALGNEQIGRAHV